MPPLGGKEDSYMNMKKAFRRPPGRTLLKSNYGHSDRFYFKFDRIYEELDNERVYVRSAASRQEPGALLPPELMLNEWCPASEIRYTATAEDYNYGERPGAIKHGRRKPRGPRGLDQFRTSRPSSEGGCLTQGSTLTQAED